MIRDRTAIQAGNRTVDVVERGEVLTVANLNAGWLLVGRGHSGWMDRTAAVPIASAAAQLNQMVEQNPADTGARIARAALWVDEHNWDAAIAEASEALRQKPDSVRALIVRAAAECGKRAFEPAQADAQAAVRLAPAYGWSYVAAGDAWRDEMHFDRAIAQYDLAAQHDPQNIHILLRRIQARQAASHPDQWQQALAEAVQLMNLSDNDPACQRECQLARARVFVKQKDLEHARVEYTDLLARNPQDVAALIDSGVAYGEARMYQWALGDLEEAFHVNPKNAEAFVARAEVRSRQLNVRGALRDADEALRLNPNCAAAYRVRGETLLKQRDTDKGLAAFAQALALEPNNPANYLARAKAYDAKRDAARAADDRRRIEEIKAAEALVPSVAMPGLPGPADPARR